MKKLSLDQTSPKTERLLHHLKKAVVGQDHVMEELGSSHERYTAKLYNPDKPLDTYLFMGPTGTGKTLTALTFAGFIREPTYKPLVINCAEFGHGHEIAKLMGSPPGYLGHRETPPMLCAENIYQGDGPGVIVFDEIEKAHDTLWNLCLGILDKGSFTLGDNRTVDMTNCFVFFTSNVGARDLHASRNPMGFGKTPKIDVAGTAIQAAKKIFTPEFLNRINHKVVFDTLDEPTVKAIIKLELNKVKERMMRMHRSFVTFGDSITDHVFTSAYSTEYNAREVVRFIEKNILFTLARAINNTLTSTGYRVFRMEYSEQDGYEVWTGDYTTAEEAVASLQPAATGAPA